MGACAHPKLIGVPTQDRCVLRYALDRHASERPEAVYAVLTKRLEQKAAAIEPPKAALVR